MYGALGRDRRLLQSPKHELCPNPLDEEQEQEKMVQGEEDHPADPLQEWEATVHQCVSKIVCAVDRPDWRTQVGHEGFNVCKARRHSCDADREEEVGEGEGVELHLALHVPWNSS